MCTDLVHTGQPLVLSAQSHPTLRVCDAVYASCCVPFVFAPARLGRLQSQERMPS